MGVHEGRGALARALKDLMIRWNETKSAWHDSVAEEFEEQHIAPLEREMRNATGAMDAMAQVLAQVNRDCK